MNWNTLAIALKNREGKLCNQANCFGLLEAGEAAVALLSRTEGVFAHPASS